MQFKYYFNTLPLKDKILLYLLVPIILGFCLFLFEKYFLPDVKIENKQSTCNIKRVKIDIDNIQAIKYIEDVASQFEINIVTLKINKRLFKIKINGSYQNSMNFIYNLEYSMKIKSLKIIKTLDGIILTEGIFVIKRIANNSLYNLEKIPNPFNKIKSYIKNSTLRLTAIIGRNICINGKWYQKNSIIGKYKIKTIHSNYVELENNNKTIKLEINKDDS